jgi:hypothetical protein
MVCNQQLHVPPSPDSAQHNSTAAPPSPVQCPAATAACANLTVACPTQLSTTAQQRLPHLCSALQPPGLGPAPAGPEWSAQSWVLGHVGPGGSLAWQHTSHSSHTRAHSTSHNRHTMYHQPDSSQGVALMQGARLAACNPVSSPQRACSATSPPNTA